VKRVLPLVFTLAILSEPAFGWGNNGNCPYSKEGVSQKDGNTEKVEKAKSSRKN